MKILAEFSLIMCVYVGEFPHFFAQSVKSILMQTVLPAEWIIVKDGPLSDELEAVINQIRFPGELRTIILPTNVTSGPARAAGVRIAKHDWIAIMDSDDICMPDRFEKQWRLI
jgi:amylovoran biosynthesis glycosyltransferase AmsE